MPPGQKLTDSTGRSLLEPRSVVERIQKARLETGQEKPKPEKHSSGGQKGLSRSKRQ